MGRTSSAATVRHGHPAVLAYSSPRLLRICWLVTVPVPGSLSNLARLSGGASARKARGSHGGVASQQDGMPVRARPCSRIRVIKMLTRRPSRRAAEPGPRRAGGAAAPKPHRGRCQPSLISRRTDETGSCGLMDKALVFGTKDCRLESCQDH